MSEQHVLLVLYQNACSLYLKQQVRPGEGLTPFRWVPARDGTAELGVRCGLLRFALSLSGECRRISLWHSLVFLWGPVVAITTSQAYRPFGKPLWGKSLYTFFFFNWVVCLFWLPGERCLCGPDASPWGVHVLPISSPALWLTFWLNSLFRSADILHFNGVQGSDHLLCGYTLCVLFKGCLSVWRSYRWPPALSLEAVLRYFSLVWARGQGSSFSLWLFTPFVDFTPPGGKCVVNLQITVDTFSCQTGEVLDPELRFPLLLLVFYISISSTISLSIWQSSFSFFLAVCLSVSHTHTHTFWHFDMDHIESINHFGENWQHIPYWVFQSINTEWISWFPLLKSC